MSFFARVRVTRETALTKNRVKQDIMTEQQARSETCYKRRAVVLLPC